MGFIWIIAIGAITGFVGSKFMRASQFGIPLDVIAGVVGAVLSAIVVRVLTDGVGPVWSGIVAIICATIFLFGMRQFMKPIVLPERTRARRRY